MKTTCLYLKVFNFGLLHILAHEVPRIYALYQKLVVCVWIAYINHIGKIILSPLSRPR